MFMDFNLDFSADLTSAVLESDLFLDPDWDTAEIMEIADSGNLDSPRNSNEDSEGSSRDYLSTSTDTNRQSSKSSKRNVDSDSTSSSSNDGKRGNTKVAVVPDPDVETIIESALTRALTWTEAHKLFEDDAMPYTNRPSGVPSGGLIYKEIKDKKRKQGEDRFINSGGVRGATDMPSGNGAQPQIRRRYGRVMREARGLPNLRYHDYRLLTLDEGILKEQHDVIIYHTLPESLESPKPRDGLKKTVSKGKKNARKKKQQVVTSAAAKMHVLSAENLKNQDTQQHMMERDQQTHQFVQQIDWASLCTPIQALPQNQNQKKIEMQN